MDRLETFKAASVGQDFLHFVAHEGTAQPTVSCTPRESSKYEAQPNQKQFLLGLCGLTVLHTPRTRHALVVVCLAHCVAEVRIDHRPWECFMSSDGVVQLGA